MTELLAPGRLSGDDQDTCRRILDSIIAATWQERKSDAPFRMLDAKSLSKLNNEIRAMDIQKKNNYSIFNICRVDAVYTTGTSFTIIPLEATAAAKAGSQKIESLIPVHVEARTTILPEVTMLVLAHKEKG
ncbi:hypothetical protein LTS08_008952 [Lithohypha guttulata]|uniref:Uncharacterized protein n=1 Tax=Lithohypha guttulata TaxID=1690604 RepID=A0AAN7SMP8_9EURO|nr:hypothetical protein LTR05_008768 [Lithohypha guttulata]KAK5093104.1 hypothetical protein LTS08_008952 [Lithohypha guttulata]